MSYQKKKKGFWWYLGEFLVILGKALYGLFEGIVWLTGKILLGLGKVLILFGKLLQKLFNWLGKSK